jgi:hypothetical protein
MKRPKHKGESPQGDALLGRAIHYAEHAMRRFGRVPPTFLAETDRGLIAYFPETMGNDHAKDNFANTARLVTVAYNASTVAMILESWITLAKPGKPLDPSIPPSQSPDREECVVIVVEGHGEMRSKFLPIQRKLLCTFTGFGTDNIPQFDEMQGRFAGMMPPTPPTKQDRRTARQLLLMMGVAPDNLGFNPSWN